MSPRASGLVAAARPVVALDFDGVICDSVGESGTTAIKAATRQWPEIFDTPAALSRYGELVEGMRGVRPVIETGYENIPQVRCLYEGTTVEEILGGWEPILADAMKKWQLDRSKLVNLFGEVRDEWIKEDTAGWLAANSIYAGVAEPVQQAAAGAADLYVVTTKQAHFTEMLLRDMAGVKIPSDHIFSQTVSGLPKSEVLHVLQERHPDASGYIFVEDKLSTLEKVAKIGQLADWSLYLVDWGYNTPAERERAAANPRITVINRRQFALLVGGPALVAV